MSDSFFKKASKGHVQTDDLLILSAAHQLDYIGRSFALVSDIPTGFARSCMAVGELIIARSNPKVIYPKYLLACFLLKPIQALVNRMTRGQSAHLYTDDLRHLSIPMPPFDEQRFIAQEIDRRQEIAKELRHSGETVLAQVRQQVERLILGEEVV